MTNDVLKESLVSDDAAARNELTLVERLRAREKDKPQRILRLCCEAADAIEHEKRDAERYRARRFASWFDYQRTCVGPDKRPKTQEQFNATYDQSSDFIAENMGRVQL